MDDMQEGLEAMQRDLEAILLTVAQDWRKFNKELEAFRRQSEKNPSSSADEAMGRVANLLGALRFHGLLIFDIDYEKKEIWEEHFVLPSSPVQRAVFVHLFQLYLLYRRTWEIINEGLVYSPLQADDLAKATCKMFIRAKLNEPYIIARTAEMVHEHFPNRTRAEALSEVLVKYLATQLSLRSDWRLGRVLREGEESAYERLLRELPAEALIAWDEREFGKTVLRDLRSKVAEGLSKQGREATIRPAKINEAPPDEVALEAFELQEESGYELGRLKGWVENAKFSELEQRVYELDMKTDHETPVIAHTLGIADATVRQCRKRYRDKLRKVAGL